MGIAVREARTEEPHFCRPVASNPCSCLMHDSSGGLCTCLSTSHRKNLCSPTVSHPAAGDESLGKREKKQEHKPHTHVHDIASGAGFIRLFLFLLHEQ